MNAQTIPHKSYIITRAAILAADKLATLYAGELRGNGYTPAKSASVTSEKVFRVEFQNGVLNVATLRLGQLAAWVKLAPADEMEISFSDECQRGEFYHAGKIQVRAGGSVAVFNNYSKTGELAGVETVPPIRFDDDGGKRPDFQFVPPAEVGNLAETLKTKKAAAALAKLREKELRSKSALKLAASEHCQNLAACAPANYAAALARAKMILQARRELRAALSAAGDPIAWLGESMTPAGEYDAGPVPNLNSEHWEHLAAIAKAQSALSEYKPRVKYSRYDTEKKWPETVYGPKHTALKTAVAEAQARLFSWITDKHRAEMQKRGLPAMFASNRDGKIEISIYSAHREFTRARLAVREFAARKIVLAQDYVLAFDARRKAQSKAIASGAGVLAQATKDGKAGKVVFIPAHEIGEVTQKAIDKGAAVQILESKVSAVPVGPLATAPDDTTPPVLTVEKTETPAAIDPQPGGERAAKVARVAAEIYEHATPAAELAKVPVADRPAAEARARARAAEYAEKLITRIETRDLKALTGILHPGNPISRAAFERETGVKLGRTSKEMFAAVRAWYGPAAFDQWQADCENARKAEHAQREATEKQKAVEYALKKPYRYAIGGAGLAREVTAREMILDLIARGYTVAETAKQGAFNVLHLRKAGENGFYVLRPKAEQDFAREQIAARQAQPAHVPPLKYGDDSAPLADRLAAAKAAPAPDAQLVATLEKLVAPVAAEAKPETSAEKYAAAFETVKPIKPATALTAEAKPAPFFIGGPDKMPATPPAEMKFQHHYGAEIPRTFHRWEFSYTFNGWSALVTFADGWHGFTYPAGAASEIIAVHGAKEFQISAPALTTPAPVAVPSPAPVLTAETIQPAADALGLTVLHTTTAAFGKLWELDETLIGSPDYMGIAYFWAHAFRHYLRDASRAQRVAVHHAWRAAGLDLLGNTSAHWQIVGKITGKAV